MPGVSRQSIQRISYPQLRSQGGSCGRIPATAPNGKKRQNRPQARYGRLGPAPGRTAPNCKILFDEPRREERPGKSGSTRRRFFLNGGGAFRSVPMDAGSFAGGEQCARVSIAAETPAAPETKGKHKRRHGHSFTRPFRRFSAERLDRQCAKRHKDQQHPPAKYMLFERILHQWNAFTQIIKVTSMAIIAQTKKEPQRQRTQAKRSPGRPRKP